MIRCERCGEMMRAETVIRLRRSFGRIRATRSEGAYCMDCKIGVAQPGPLVSPPHAKPRRAGLGFAEGDAAPVCSPA